MRPGHRPLWRDSHGGGSTALIWIKGWPHEISDRPQMRNNDGRPSKRPAVNLPPTAEMICAIDEESARSPQPGELPAAHCHQVVRHVHPAHTDDGGQSGSTHLVAARRAQVFSVVWEARAPMRAIQSMELAFRTASTRLRT
jgi:hypothetical protein